MRDTSPFSPTAKLRRALSGGEVSFQQGDLTAAEHTADTVLVRLDHTNSRNRPAAGDMLELRVSAIELKARVRRELADLAAAVELHQMALALLDTPQASAQLQSLRITVLIRLGESLRILGRYRESEDFHRRAWGLADDTPTAPMELVAALNGLGIVYKDTQRFINAAGCYKRALTIAIETVGPEAPELADIYHNLAGLQHIQARFTDGEPYARRALALRLAREGAASTGVAGDLAVLGAILLGQGRHAEAEQALGQALSIWHQRFGLDHYEVAIVEHNLAALHLARGEHQQALDCYRNVLRIKRRVLGPGNHQVMALQAHLDKLSHDRRTATGQT
jgi:tetratricopeptide (TPR) repeat protein